MNGEAENFEFEGLRGILRELGLETYRVHKTALKILFDMVHFEHFIAAIGYGVGHYFGYLPTYDDDGCFDKMSIIDSLPRNIGSFQRLARNDILVHRRTKTLQTWWIVLKTTDDAWRVCMETRILQRCLRFSNLMPKYHAFFVLSGKTVAEIEEDLRAPTQLISLIPLRCVLRKVLDLNETSSQKNHLVSALKRVISSKPRAIARVSDLKLRSQLDIVVVRNKTGSGQAKDVVVAEEPSKNKGNSGERKSEKGKTPDKRKRESDELNENARRQVKRKGNNYDY